jgi:cysteinyl-tRNA synthetase
MNFTWTAVEGAQQALHRAWKVFADLPQSKAQPNKKLVHRFRTLMSDDLDTPKAIALLWEVVKDPELDGAIKRATILDFDRVLGVGFSLRQEERGAAAVTEVLDSRDIPSDVRTLMRERDAARAQKNFVEADRLRKAIETAGYTLTDTPEGTAVRKHVL